jgi:hypothetical protein
MSGLSEFGAFGLASSYVWNNHARRARKMAEFSHVEEGSSLDMLFAAEAPDIKADLRRKFFVHALDEHRHSREFAERATVLSDRSEEAQNILQDRVFIQEHGIRSSKSLFEQMSLAEFLAFVWMQERQAGIQFGVIANLVRDDPQSAELFEGVQEDERFHTNYSRLELERLGKAQGEYIVTRAVRNVRWRGWRNTALRLSRAVGDVMGGMWLFVIFFLFLAPFALMARVFDKPKLGFIETPDAKADAMRNRFVQA